MLSVIRRHAAGRPLPGPRSRTSTAQARRTVHYRGSMVGQSDRSTKVGARLSLPTTGHRRYPTRRVVIVNMYRRAARLPPTNRLTVPARFDRLPGARSSAEQRWRSAREPSTRHRRGPPAGRRLRAQLRRPAPPAEPARGARRRRALPVLLRRALRPGLPDLDRHPAVHPPDRHRQPAWAPPRPSSIPTSWAACAPGCARPRPCARRSASARSPRASRSRSAACSATPPMRCSPPAASSTARALATGHKVAVVGAGPAGLACAHKLATLGHAVTVFEARDKPGGLNEYGIAAYKTVDGFAQAEVGLDPGRRRDRAAHRRAPRPRHRPWPTCAATSPPCSWASGSVP